MLAINSTSRGPLALLLFCALLASHASAAPPGPVVLDDPPRDDDGNGRYVYPSNQAYRRNSFDLRRFTVERDGNDLIFRVALGKPIWRPPETRRSEAARFVLDNGVYVQHIDIYIDQRPGEGHTDALPGRNFVVEPESAWEKAVVLTPRPFYLKSLIGEWKPSRDVLVPRVRSYANVVEARISMASLGGRWDPAWGYLVISAGAVWENTFDAFDRLVGGPIQNALTMPVVTVAEPLAFGGGELEAWHPFVIDAIVPEGLRQSALLNSFDSATRQLASLPAVYPDPDARRAAVMTFEATQSSTLAAIPKVSAAPGRETKVREVRDELVVLELLPDVNTFAMGDVLEDGVVAGRVVVTAVYPKFILATVVEGKESIRPGATVRFPRSPQK